MQYIDPEFSAVCPMTGLPDFGKVIVQYVPDKHVAELKAFKLYLRCYYGVGIMHEPVTRKICTDFVEAIKPRIVRVVGDWGARGGIKTVTSVAWSSQRGYHSVPAHWDHDAFRNAVTNWTNE